MLAWWSDAIICSLIVPCSGVTLTTQICRPVYLVQFFFDENIKGVWDVSYLHGAHLWITIFLRIRLSLLLKYCLHVKIIPANMWTHRLWLWGIKQNLLGPGSFLNDPSQPFSITSKLLILHGEAKSYCFTVSSVPKSLPFHL